MTVRFLAAPLGIVLAMAFAERRDGPGSAEGESAAPDAEKQGRHAQGQGGESEGRKEARPVASLERATFGGGCFWCMEAVFERVSGVKSVVSGYAGGTVARPDYYLVGTGMTGHAEVVQIVYDPKVVSYDSLLKVFWLAHDPTTLNRQGPDEGTQYRSIILYHNEDQRKAALKSYEKITQTSHSPLRPRS